ncbi:MAG: nitroreductase family protein [Oscillospiraceae bacterium]|nr:nitroreductase family protein [Oscillospiraceae bacterium]
MNEALQNLLTRRSTKHYKPEQIPEEKLDAVLKAGTYAPTARGLQSPLIVSVQNADDIAVMSELNARIKGDEGDPFYGAPTVVVVFADPKAKGGVNDATLVLGNMLNAAHAVGLAGRWINRAKETFELPEGKALMRRWGISEDWVGVGNCILGIPDGPLPEAAPRKEGYVVKIK